MKGPRTETQIREHYEVERALADRLRRAPKAERRDLYRSVYDELFQRVPHHSMLTRKAPAEKSRENLRGRSGCSPACSTAT